MDYYKILEVSRNASIDDIKKSYRKLAMKYHPDRNQNNKAAEEKFKGINEAYRVIGDTNKKKQYDNFGHEDNHQNFNHSNVDMEDILKDIFGSRQNPFGSDFENIFSNSSGFKKTPSVLNINLSFWEAVFGTQKKVELNFTRGDGNVTNNSVTINFPNGVDDGDVLKIKVSGVEVLIRISVQNDELFRRDGIDLYTDMDIPITTAMFGGEIAFPHWDGEIKIKIPAGVQHDNMLKIKARGIKKEPKFGNLYIVCKIKIPVSLTSSQKEIMKKFAATIKPETNSWYDKIKSLWA